MYLSLIKRFNQKIILGKTNIRIILGQTNIIVMLINILANFSMVIFMVKGLSYMQMERLKQNISDLIIPSLNSYVSTNKSSFG
tara:strand:- start:172 stop:420 length:249 start_codon:yes stop_codon:yes gene_type:complete